MYIIDLDERLSDWISEPPLLKNTPSEDMQKNICDKGMPALTYSSIPCYLQTVERMMKLVTEASMKVCGEQTKFYCYYARMTQEYGKIWYKKLMQLSII